VQERAAGTVTGMTTVTASLTTTTPGDLIVVPAPSDRTKPL
jgi:hypothetical protein